jgi:DNA-binding CsgD family transcriptional regulator
MTADALNADELLRAQRLLRHRLLDNGTAVRWRPARDLAAHLLLHLDSPVDCLRLSAKWLCRWLRAERVDAAFHAADGLLFTPSAEAQGCTGALPSVIGTSFDAQDAGICRIWSVGLPVGFRDVMAEPWLGAQTRTTLRRLGTRAKFTLPVFDGRRPVGMLCADWSAPHPGWTPQTCDHLAQLAAEVLGPVLGATRRLAGHTATGAWPGEVPPPLAVLTPSELRLARMVAMGLSYKEAARQLDRSLSTVDHRLRSMRHKLGAPSTARLAVMLAQLLPPA